MGIWISRRIDESNVLDPQQDSSGVAPTANPRKSGLVGHSANSLQKFIEGVDSSYKAIFTQHQYYNPACVLHPASITEDSNNMALDLLNANNLDVSPHQRTHKAENPDSSASNQHHLLPLSICILDGNTRR